MSSSCYTIQTKILCCATVPQQSIWKVNQQTSNKPIWFATAAQEFRDFACLSVSRQNQYGLSRISSSIPATPYTRRNGRKLRRRRARLIREPRYKVCCNATRYLLAATGPSFAVLWRCCREREIEYREMRVPGSSWICNILSSESDVYCRLATIHIIRRSASRTEENACWKKSLQFSILKVIDTRCQEAINSELMCCHLNLQLYLHHLNYIIVQP